MKSCWIVTKDHKNHLEFRDVPQPQPKAGEIVIKVHATALNRGELFVGGVVHGGPEKLGGGEASGVVHAIGDGVTGVKVGDTMHTALSSKDAKEWFGAQPPDLTLVARSRSDGSKGTGADYLYTYLRTYYRDET